MSLDLMKNTYLYGNLDLVYKISDIKKIDLKNFETWIKNFKILKNDRGFCWRFYNNFEFILNSYESIIFKDHKKLKNFLEIFYNIIQSIDDQIKFKKSPDLEYIEKNEDFYYVLINLLVRKINVKIKLHESDRDFFDFKFHLFKPEDPYHFYLDYSTPYDYIRWTSNWKLVSRERNLLLKNIDIYIDSYFKNSNLYYNENMKNDLKFLKDRLEFLKTESPEYLEFLKSKLNEVSEKLYYIFPYNKIYKDYKELIKVDDKIFKKIDGNAFNQVSDIKWFFHILPNFLSAYLLGFPIISLDVPGEKIIEKYINIMETKKTPKEYYEWFSENFNKKYLNSIEFETDVGNGIEDNDSVDLCYVKIKDYNQDDIVSIFNNNIMHHFSCKEFETILQKEENPYNREKITNFRKIIDNLKFKKKIKKRLMMKGLDLNLDSTMLENFEEVLEKIKDQESNVNFSLTHNESVEQFYQPLLDIFFRQI